MPKGKNKNWCPWCFLAWGAYNKYYRCLGPIPDLFRITEKARESLFLVSILGKSPHQVNSEKVLDLISISGIGRNRCLQQSEDFELEGHVKGNPLIYLPLTNENPLTPSSPFLESQLVCQFPIYLTLYPFGSSWLFGPTWEKQKKVPCPQLPPYFRRVKVFTKQFCNLGQIYWSFD